MDISQRETNSAVHNSSIYYLAQTAPLYQAVPHTPPPTIAIRKSLAEDISSDPNSRRRKTREQAAVTSAFSHTYDQWLGDHPSLRGHQCH